MTKLHPFFLELFPASAQHGRAPSRPGGFTIVELVVMISIIGILALVAIPRLMSTSIFEARGFYDQAVAVVRFAQKIAIVQRRLVFVVVPAGGNRISACYDAACASRVLTPVAFPRTPSMGSALAACANDNTWLCAGAPGGVTLSTTAVSFDGLGRPAAATTITLTSTVAGDPSRQIDIAAETGYVQ